MGQACSNLCKSKKREKTKEDLEKEAEMRRLLQELMESGQKPKKEIPNLIEKHKLTGFFDNYMEQNFDLKNIMKYLEDEQSGIFSFEFLLKVMQAAFVLMNFVAERGTIVMLAQRRQALRNQDYDKFKVHMKEMEEFHSLAFESCLEQVKQKVQIIESNFQKTYAHHMQAKNEENAKKLKQLEKRGSDYHRNWKLNSLMQKSNISKITRKEALALQKQQQSIQLELMRRLFEDIPKAQRSEESPYLQPMIEDTLFIRTGMEMGHLDAAFSLLKLHEDPEYKAMFKDYEDAYNAMVKDAKQRNLI